MNYYEKHIGDYIKDTVSLSMLEDGAYNRLIDQCYQTEKPLPLDVKEIYREARAISAAERKAVDYVLRKFFVETEAGYVQKRINAEIARYQDKQRKAKASADARWSKDRSHSELDAFASDPHDASDMRTHSEGNALQSPDTSNQSLKKTVTSPAKLPTCPHDAIVDLYHEVLHELPRVRLMPPKRKKAIGKIWDWVLTSKKKSDGSRRAESAEQALAWLRNYFDRARNNDFLMGRTPRVGEHANWQCDLDFLLTDKGMTQVIEKTKETT